jgi:PAS domain S-box-containing protein
VSAFNRPLSSRPSWIWRYGLAFVLIASIWFLSRWMTPRFAFPGTLYLCSVMLSVWFGGVGPGLLASVLSTLAYHLYFRHSQDPTLREMPRLFMVFLSNILVASVSAAQWNAKESLKRTRDDLTETVKHLRRTNEALLTESREREQAENRLRRSEEYLAEAQRLTKTGSWAYDPATEKALYWSDEMFRIHGLDPQQGPPTSKAFLEHAHPDDRDTLREAMLRVVREKTEYEVEHQMILPDGTIAHLHAHGHPVLDRSGNVLEIVGSAVDVTEHKRLRELEANLAHMNRVSMMGELAAALAHEIKQPIAAAITNANTGLRWLAREEPDLEEGRQAIMRTVKDGTRAIEIVNRLRSFYKKGVQPQLEMVDVNEVAREMLMLLRDEAYRYSIAMRTELAPELPIVKTDRVQLQQVFMNLMLNAIEAMKDTAGEITVKSQLSDNGEFLVSISDTGVGLPEERPEQIFDAFYTTKSQGTGMGLAITRSIIQAHKGRLWASANPGGGAIFHFTLPIEASASSTSVE